MWTSGRYLSGAANDNSGAMAQSGQKRPKSSTACTLHRLHSTCAKPLRTYSGSCSCVAGASMLLRGKASPCRCWRCSARRCCRSWWLTCTTYPAASHPECPLPAQRRAHPTGAQPPCPAACLWGTLPQSCPAPSRWSWRPLWRQRAQPALSSTPPCSTGSRLVCGFCHNSDAQQIDTRRHANMT